MVEIVRDVPSDLAILSPVLHDSVEETDHKDKGFEGLMRTFVEGLLGELGESRTHVELETIRRLSDHLQCLLQDAQRESVSGLRG